MAKPAQKATTTPEPNPHRRLWDKLGKSDPNQTKPITGRGYDGTALKPMWQNMRMTEEFGPVGQGWGMEKPEFETFTRDEEILVYCTVKVWYLEAGKTTPAFIYGVGGDVVAGVRNSGKKFIDDEAFKKSYTDALCNAFKFIGVAADIHMGMFDDSKYVQQLKQEFAAADDTLGKEIDALEEKIRTCDDRAILEGEILDKARALREKLIKEKRDGEAQRLITVYNARLAYFNEKDG